MLNVDPALTSKNPPRDNLGLQTRNLKKPAPKPAIRTTRGHTKASQPASTHNRTGIIKRPSREPSHAHCDRHTTKPFRVRIKNQTPPRDQKRRDEAERDFGHDRPVHPLEPSAL
jgi:hypothetical protein